MDSIETIFGWKAVTVWIILLAFSMFYAWLVYSYLPEKKKIKNRTAELVVLGTLVTILGYGIIIGWNTLVKGFEALLVLILCFAFTGAPMIAGYWNKDASLNAQDEERAKEQFRKASKTIQKDEPK